MSNIDHAARIRLDYVEAQLTALFPDRYVSYADTVRGGIPPEVIDLVRAGQKIAAITAYRAHTGLGLKEAKEVIDSL